MPTKQNHAFLFIITYLFKLTGMPQSNSYTLNRRFNPSLKMNQSTNKRWASSVSINILKKVFGIVSERCIPLISAWYQIIYNFPKFSTVTNIFLSLTSEHTRVRSHHWFLCWRVDIVYRVFHNCWNKAIGHKPRILNDTTMMITFIQRWKDNIL